MKDDKVVDMTGRRKATFDHVPLCEVCREKPAHFFVFWPSEPGSNVGQWRFVCDCGNDDRADYDIEIDDFFKTPGSTVKWMAHLREKNWTNAESFFDMMWRFQAATNSYRTQ